MQISVRELYINYFTNNDDRWNLFQIYLYIFLLTKLFSLTNEDIVASKLFGYCTSTVIHWYLVFLDEQKNTVQQRRLKFFTKKFSICTTTFTYAQPRNKKRQGCGKFWKTNTVQRTIRALVFRFDAERMANLAVWNRWTAPPSMSYHLD